MTSEDSITLALAEHKHGSAFGLMVFCRTFDGDANAEICVGAVGQPNRLANLGFGDYLLYEIDDARFEIRLIETKSTKSDPQAVLLVSRLSGEK